MSDPVPSTLFPWLQDAASLQGLLVAALALLAVVAVLWLRSARRHGERLVQAEWAATEAGQARAEAERRAEAALQAREAEALRAGTTEARLELREARLAELGAERDGLADALHSARGEAAALERSLAETRLAATKDRESAAREVAQLKELRAEMTTQFKALSAEMLRIQAEDARRAQTEGLSALLNPLREQVNRFQTELQTRARETHAEREKLGQQIEFLHRRSEEIGREAVALTRALKGEKQRQGAWGEMILERILEDSGLEKGIHYVSQESHVDADGTRWRPDVIVHMPQRKTLVIDSKVSLNAYEVAVNAEDEDARRAALAEHCRAIRTHVKDLAARRYEALDEASVDYVLMFIPIEGAFSEALRAAPDLASFALENRVGLSTPMTLMLTLRTVEHLWTVERRETNALEIASRAGQLYDKVAGFVESLDQVGVAIDRASRAHGEAVDRLTRGRGNVIRQIEMLRELGARASKRLEIDHDYDGAADTTPPVGIEDARDEG